MKRSRLLLVPLGAAAVLSGVGWIYQSGPSGAPPAAAVEIASRYAGFDHARLLKDVDTGIAALQQRLATPAGDMIDQESLALAFLDRSRLTGDFADLVKAREAAGAGIAMSPPGTGPWLAQAAADYSAHRIADAAKSLDVVDRFVVPDKLTRAEARAMRSDIAFTRGDYRAAARLVEEAAAMDDWPGLWFRRALLARARGDFDGARKAFTQANAMNLDPTPRFRADMQLRLGELEFAQGRWTEAQGHFQQAQRALPGYWRTEMKLAQMQAISGETTAALAEFERIAERWNEPDAMYVAAGLNRDLGRMARSRMWIDRATAAWQQRLAQLPEAAWGHALEHELAFGSPQRALDLAQKNAQNRPYGIPLLLLAEAWIANDQPAKALAVCDAVLASGWVSADQWTIRAVALDKLGRAAEAETARSKARAINPREDDPNPALAWFHD